MRCASSAVSRTRFASFGPVQRISRLLPGSRGFDLRAGGVPAPPSLLAKLPAVDHRDVDGPAARAADANLLRHLHRLHRRRQDVPARNADVVVGPVAVEDGAVRILLNGGPAVARDLA